jgi:hypothetical protein
MKLWLLMIHVSVLSFLLPATTQARVGETLKQCTERYGQSLLTKYPGYDENLRVGTRDAFVEHFKHAGFLVIVYFHKGTATMVEYHKLTNPDVDVRTALGDGLRPSKEYATYIGDDQVAELMSKNGGGQSWTSDGKFGPISGFKTAGNMKAQLWQPQGRSFLIIFDEQLENDRNEAVKAANESIKKAQVKGF